MSEETKVELGLKEVLEECLEALHSSILSMESDGRYHPREVEKTRAALAVVERWAAESEPFNTAIEALEFQMDHLSTRFTPGVLRNRAISDIAEALNALRPTAASLECRRRNGEA